VRLTLSVTLLAGAILLWLTSRRERSRVPRWVPALAVAIASLGLSTLATTQPGVAWSISSICFSLIAIVLILVVIRDILRR
jgi:peptidoglycan/LPS O-acetylase OafA/YrhL